MNVEENVDGKPVEPIVDEQKPSVNMEAYEQMKNDMHKFKRQAQEAETERQRVASDLKAIETKQMSSQGKYKELYENTLQELENSKSELNGTREMVMDDKKITAVRQAALKSGIREEAFNDLNILAMDGVVVETTDQGRYSVLGVDSFIEGLKSSRPHWFTNSQAPNINNSTGSFNSEEKSYSASEVIELQKSNPQLYRELLTTKKHLIRR